MILKTDLRHHWLQVRCLIPSKRREEAKKQLFCLLTKELKGTILSFASFGSEIETDSLNRWLADRKALLLPRVEETDLYIYCVKDVTRDLVRSKWGMLEPDPEKCSKVDFQAVQTVLVPGLAFDLSLYRLGFGQGHYDRLLPKLSCPSIGIAFSEQQSDPLPRDPWDVPLQKVLYF